MQPVTPEYIEEVFTSLEAMTVELDDDPLEYGPRRLAHKVAETRTHLSRCEQLSLQISRLLQQYKRGHRAAQLEFDLKLQHMLANDPEVRAGRNVADRNAIATVKLNEQRESMSYMEVVIQDLEVVMTSIKSKRADLRDVQGRLRDQMRLCQEEVGLGGKWGSKAAGSGPSLSNAPLIDMKALRDLDSMLGSSAELHVTDPVDLVVSTPLLGAADEEGAEESDEAAGEELASPQAPAPAPLPPAPALADLQAPPAFPEIPTGEGKDDDFDTLLSALAPPVEAPGKRPSVSVDDLLNSLLDP
jgi:hypothetical protein